MCLPRPLMRLKVSDRRLDLIQQKLRQYSHKVRPEQVYEVAAELGWYDAVQIHEGKVRFDLSPLQKVALVAAIVAASEEGCQLEHSPDYDPAGDPQEYVDVDA